MKSFKHEDLIYLYLYISSEHTFLFQLHRLIKALDLELFLLKLISCLQFLKSLKCDNWYKLYLYGQMSSHTEFQLLIKNSKPQI